MVHVVKSPAARPVVVFERVFVWQWGLRAFHWINAAAMTVLFLTGLYITHPVFTSTGEPFDVFVMARVRQVHFASAFVFAIAIVWRVFLFLFGNEYARSGGPAFWKRSWWKALFSQVWDYVTLNFERVELGHNALAGLSYAVCVIGLGLGQVLTGFALYSESNPGGVFDRLFGWVLPMLGGSFRTHMWHDLFAWGFLAFVIVHVYVVLLDSRQYHNGLISSMITGFKFRPLEKKDRDGR